MKVSIHLSAKKWKEAEKFADEGGIVVVPVAAFEQHGHHLPLDTDQRLVTYVAEKSCEKAQDKNIPVLVTPTIWTGFSPHHMNFAGTITLKMKTFLSLIEDVCNSLWSHGIRKILLLNGHGGNASLLRSSVQNLRFQYEIRAVTASYWDFAIPYIQSWRTSKIGGINHGCEMETSLMLHLSEHLVDKDKCSNEVRMAFSEYLGVDLTKGGTVTASFDLKELSNSGVVGDPSVATKESGEKLFEHITDKIAEFLEEFYTWDWNQIHNEEKGEFNHAE